LQVLEEATMAFPGSKAKPERIQQLFIQHLAEIRGYLLAILPDAELVDDALQETFLALVEKAEAYDPERSFRLWAFGFARNKAMQVAARRPGNRGRNLPLEDDVLAVLTASEPDLAVGVNEMQFLRECMSQLAPKARSIVEHRYQKGLMPHEVAELIGWSRGAVRVALCRARSVLRKCLESKLAAAGAS